MIAINPLVDAAPYYALLGVCVMVVAAVLLKYPSIKAYRKKRNLLAYAIIIIIIDLIAYQAISVSLGPNYVSFSIQKTQTPILAGRQNQFSVTCNSDGAETKPVYFIVDSNVSSISFYPFIEAQNGSPFVVEVYLREFQCTYDAATNSYAMADSSPVAVP
jgi:hypothetical protein